MEIISLGSFPKDLWVKCLDKFMGYGSKIPAYQIGGPKKLWDCGGYSFMQVWDKAGSTVVEKMKVDGIIYFEKYVLTSATC